MPYPRAWLWVSLLLILTFPAFWPNYLSQLNAVEWQVHVHGVSAGLWVVLVIFQSWAIHAGHGAFHRTAGLATLILAPLFLAGGCLVVATMAVRPGPFTEMFGARLGLLDIVSVFAFAGFIYMALRHRRNVGLHSGWMVATIFLLINPTLARLFPAFIPGMTIRSVEELPRFAASVHLAQVIAIALAVFLYYSYRRHGRPMLVLVGVLFLQLVLFETLAESTWWKDVDLWIGATPPAILIAFGFGLGLVAVVAGWMSGSSRPAAPAPA